MMLISEFLTTPALRLTDNASVKETREKNAHDELRRLVQVSIAPGMRTELTSTMT